MTPTHVETKSLSGKIFRTVLAFTLAVIVVLGAVLTTIFYFADEHRAEDRLAARAEHAVAILDGASESESRAILDGQFDDEVRCTIVSVDDGTVLYDSAVDAGSLESHADRPEVAAAIAGSETVVTSRFSETLGTDTLYAATDLDDGYVLRLSEERESLAAFLGNMIAPVAVALAVACALVFALSRMLTKRIMKPIDALDFSNLLDNEIYEEMDPLLIRIDEQQRQLVQQNQELAAAESMRRDFSSNVSHEMKTPLQVISGYAELMKNDMIDPDDRQRFAELIYDEAQSMRSLINDVLTLSRLDETAFGDDADIIDVRSLAERVRGRIMRLATERDVSVAVEGEIAYVSGNPTLAEEMIYNLVENGIRYNRAGGSVTVSVGTCWGVLPPVGDSAALSPSARALRSAGGDRSGRSLVVVRVQDTGPGIPAELRDKVFERFFRLEKSRSKETGGTGLGLAIVKHAVIYHGGTIEIEDAEGGGTAFVIKLPACDPPVLDAEGEGTADDPADPALAEEDRDGRVG